MGHLTAVVTLVVLAGCGDNRAVAVDSADVSIMYPLPDTIDAIDAMVRPAEVATYGELFPEAWFPTTIGPIDQGTTYGDLRLVALRLDPCSARVACNSEVRAIFQPIVVAPTGEPTVADGAIHVFYGVPQDELVAFAGELVTLKQTYGTGILYGDTLGPHPILAATGLDGEFAHGLAELVLAHLGASRIERFTEFNHQIPARDRWDFYLFERGDAGLARHDIATTGADEQQVTGTQTDPQQPGGIEGVAPVLDSALLAIVDEHRPVEVTDAIRAGFARAIELQDPTKATSESIDCVSCHLAEGARRVGQDEYGLATTEPHIPYRRDLTAVTNLHMFAYVGRAVSVTQRVANESAVTAATIEQLLNAP